MTRESFEAFISAPPFEMPIDRFDDRSAWPGSYTELEVDLAWQAWQAATDAALASAPSWHDAPTCAGLWHVKTHPRSHPTVIAEVFVSDVNAVPTHCRWYGPIPEDKP